MMIRPISSISSELKILDTILLFVNLSSSVKYSYFSFFLLPLGILRRVCELYPFRIF